MVMAETGMAQEQAAALLKKHGSVRAAVQSLQD